MGTHLLVHVLLWPDRSEDYRCGLQGAVLRHLHNWLAGMSVLAPRASSSQGQVGARNGFFPVEIEVLPVSLPIQTRSAICLCSCCLAQENLTHSCLLMYSGVQAFLGMALLSLNPD